MANQPHPPRVGDHVLITNGPLAGYAAQVREVDDARSRLKLDAEVRGMRVPIEVEAWQVGTDS